MKVLRYRYKFRGRLRSAIQTYKENHFFGKKLSWRFRIRRSINNFNDVPLCSCPTYCTIHEKGETMKAIFEICVHLDTKDSGTEEVTVKFKIFGITIKTKKQKFMKALFG